MLHVCCICLQWYLLLFVVPTYSPRQLTGCWFHQTLFSWRLRQRIWTPAFMSTLYPLKVIHLIFITLSSVSLMLFPQHQAYIPFWIVPCRLPFSLCKCSYVSKRTNNSTNSWTVADKIMSFNARNITKKMHQSVDTDLRCMRYGETEMKQSIRQITWGWLVTLIKVHEITSNVIWRRTENPIKYNWRDRFGGCIMVEETPLCVSGTVPLDSTATTAVQTRGG